MNLQKNLLQKIIESSLLSYNDKYYIYLILYNTHKRIYTENEAIHLIEHILVKDITLFNDFSIYISIYNHNDDEYNIHLNDDKFILTG